LIGWNPAILRGFREASRAIGCVHIIVFALSTAAALGI